MSIDSNIAAKSEVLRELLRTKLGVRSRSLEQGLRRAGRKLPRRIRAQGTTVARAEHLQGNPRIARQLNPEPAEAAYQEMRSYLRGVDVADRRKGQVLNILGVVAFNLLVIIVAFILWLVWRGYV